MEGEFDNLQDGKSERGTTRGKSRMPNFGKRNPNSSFNLPYQHRLSQLNDRDVTWRPPVGGSDEGLYKMSNKVAPKTESLDGTRDSERRTKNFKSCGGYRRTRWVERSYRPVKLSKSERDLRRGEGRRPTQGHTARADTTDESDLEAQPPRSSQGHTCLQGQVTQRSIAYLQRPLARSMEELSLHYPTGRQPEDYVGLRDDDRYHSGPSTQQGFISEVEGRPNKVTHASSNHRRRYSSVSDQSTTEADYDDRPNSRQSTASKNSDRRRTKVAGKKVSKSCGRTQTSATEGLDPKCEVSQTSLRQSPDSTSHRDLRVSRISGCSRIFNQSILNIQNQPTATRSWREGVKVKGDGQDSQDGGKSPLDGRKSLLDGRKSSLDGRKSSLDGGKSPLDSGKSPLDGGKSSVEGGKSPLDDGKSPVEVGKSPVEVGKSHLDGGKSPVDGGKSPLDGGKRNCTNGGKSPLDDRKSSQHHRKSPLNGVNSRNPPKSARKTYPGRRKFPRDKERESDRTNIIDQQRVDRKIVADCHTNGSSQPRHAPGKPQRHLKSDAENSSCLGPGQTSKLPEAKNARNGRPDVKTHTQTHTVAHHTVHHQPSHPNGRSKEAVKQTNNSSHVAVPARNKTGFDSRPLHREDNGQSNTNTYAQGYKSNHSQVEHVGMNQTRNQPTTNRRYVKPQTQGSRRRNSSTADQDNVTPCNENLTYGDSTNNRQPGLNANSYKQSPSPKKKRKNSRKGRRGSHRGESLTPTKSETRQSGTAQTQAGRASVNPGHCQRRPPSGHRDKLMGRDQTTGTGWSEAGPTSSQSQRSQSGAPSDKAARSGYGDGPHGRPRSELKHRSQNQSQGQTSQGQISRGQIPRGLISQDLISQGQIQQGQIPRGQFPQGQVSQGQRSNLKDKSKVNSKLNSSKGQCEGPSTRGNSDRGSPDRSRLLNSSNTIPCMESWDSPNAKHAVNDAYGALESVSMDDGEYDSDGPNRHNSYSPTKSRPFRTSCGSPSSVDSRDDSAHYYDPRYRPQSQSPVRSASLNQSCDSLSQDEALPDHHRPRATTVNQDDREDDVFIVSDNLNELSIGRESSQQNQDSSIELSERGVYSPTEFERNYGPRKTYMKTNKSRNASSGREEATEDRDDLRPVDVCYPDQDCLAGEYRPPAHGPMPGTPPSCGRGSFGPRFQGNIGFNPGRVNQGGIPQHRGAWVGDEGSGDICNVMAETTPVPRGPLPCHTQTINNPPIGNSPDKRKLGYNDSSNKRRDTSSLSDEQAVSPAVSSYRGSQRSPAYHDNFHSQNHQTSWQYQQQGKGRSRGDLPPRFVKQQGIKYRHHHHIGQDYGAASHGGNSGRWFDSSQMSLAPDQGHIVADQQTDGNGHGGAEETEDTFPAWYQTQGYNRDAAQRPADSYYDGAKGPPQRSADSYYDGAKGPSQRPADSYYDGAKGPPQRPVDSYNDGAKGPPQRPADSYNDGAKGPPQQPADSYNDGAKGPPQQPVDSYNDGAKGQGCIVADQQTDGNGHGGAEETEDTFSAWYQTQGYSRDAAQRPADSYTDGAKGPPQRQVDSYNDGAKGPPQQPGDSYNDGAKGPSQRPADSHNDGAKGPPQRPGDSYNDGAKGPSQRPADSHNDGAKGPPQPPADSYNVGAKAPPQPPADSYNDGAKGPPQRPADSYNDGAKGPSQRPADSYNDGAKGPPQRPADSYNDGAKGPPQRPADSYNDGAKGPSQRPADSYNDGAKGPPQRPADSYNDGAKGSSQRPADSYNDGAKGPSQRPADRYNDGAKGPPQQPADSYYDGAKGFSQQPADSYNHGAKGPQLWDTRNVVESAEQSAALSMAAPGTGFEADCVDDVDWGGVVFGDYMPPPIPSYTDCTDTESTTDYAATQTQYDTEGLDTVPPKQEAENGFEFQQNSPFYDQRNVNAMDSRQVTHRRQNPQSLYIEQCAPTPPQLYYSHLQCEKPKLVDYDDNCVIVDKVELKDDYDERAAIGWSLNHSNQDGSLVHYGEEEEDIYSPGEVPNILDTFILQDGKGNPRNWENVRESHHGANEEDCQIVLTSTVPTMTRNVVHRSPETLFSQHTEAARNYHQDETVLTATERPSSYYSTPRGLPQSVAQDQAWRTPGGCSMGPPGRLTTGPSIQPIMESVVEPPPRPSEPPRVSSSEPVLKATEPPSWGRVHPPQKVKGRSTAAALSLGLGSIMDRLKAEPKLANCGVPQNRARAASCSAVGYSTTKMPPGATVDWWENPSDCGSDSSSMSPNRKNRRRTLGCMSTTKPTEQLRGNWGPAAAALCGGVDDIYNTTDSETSPGVDVKALRRRTRWSDPPPPTESLTEDPPWMKAFQLHYSRLNTVFFDTHCHVDFLLKRSGFVGSFEKYRMVNKSTFPEMYAGCLAVFCDPRTFRAEGQWREILSDPTVWGAVGCHPKQATYFDTVAQRGLTAMLMHKRVKALGEIGLDYSGMFFQHKDRQQEVFISQIQLAVELKLPLVIHCRDAEDDCLRILTKHAPSDHRIHRHCFTGGWSEAAQWLDRFPNSYIGLTPLITHSGGRSIPPREVAQNIPLDKLLLETDAPYFVPRIVPREQMKHSHPGMAVTVAAEVAQLRGIGIDEVLRHCLVNSEKMYGITIDKSKMAAVPRQ